MSAKLKNIADEAAAQLLPGTTDVDAIRKTIDFVGGCYLDTFQMDMLTTMVEKRLKRKVSLCVWRDGLAEITANPDPGTITVATGHTEWLQKQLVYCRLMKDGSGRYLVNGIPEAANDAEAGEALARFKTIINNKLAGRPAFEGIKS